MARCGPVRRLGAMLIYPLTIACSQDTGQATGREAEPGVTLFSESPPMWFDAYFSSLQVSPDGERAVFDYNRLIDLRTGEEFEMPGGLDVVFRARFDRDGLIVAGRLGDEQGWFRPEADGAGTGRAVRDPMLPASFVFEPSPSGDQFAYARGGDRLTLITVDRAGADGSAAEPSETPLPAVIAGLAWLPDGTGIVTYTMDDVGVGSLHVVDPTTGEVTTVARELDGSSTGVGLAVSDDGRLAYLELAGPDAPSPEERHAPTADRDLDIWEVDLESGERRAVIQAPGEQLSPRLVDGTLHWVSIGTRSEVVILPMPARSDVPPDVGEAAGSVRIVASGAQLGTWRPDGRAVGITIGDWRLADWALNLDGAVVDIDGDGRPTGEARTVITGYHEDFSPVWSPDGSWIAYHSHRSASPVTAYSAEGSSDDIYLRRADDPDAEEIRLTDFGIEVGNPDWSPDGRRIVMDTWNQGGGSSTWILELDPATGALLDRTRVPQPDDAIGGPVWATWSPVREEIAITYADAASTEMWVMAPDGSNARRVGGWEGGRYGGLDWTADGEAIVYAAPVGGRFRLYAVARDGGEPWLVSEDGANLLHPQVSPDGRWVAVSRIEHERRIVRMER